MSITLKVKDFTNQELVDAIANWIIERCSNEDDYNEDTRDPIEIANTLKSGKWLEWYEWKLNKGHTG